MGTLITLPPEILSEITQKLDLREIITFRSTCRAVRQFTRFDKFFSLVDDLDNDRPLPEETLQSAGSFVLSHVLLYQMQRLEWDREVAQALVKHGASLGLVPCGEYLHGLVMDEGESFKVRFAVANGASLHDVPGGIHELLGEVLQDQGRCPAVDFLLEHGASLDKIKDIDQLFADLYYEDMFDATGLLEEHGYKMRTLPEEMYSLYNDFWFRDGDNMSLSSQHHGNSSLQAAVRVLRKLEEDTPEALPVELGRICDKYSIVSARMMIEEEPSWSLRSIPGGVDRLLQERWSSLGVKEIVFLVQQGASLENTDLDKNQLLVDALESIGPGPAVEYLISEGASFESVEGGVHGLLERAYSRSGPAPIVNYLMEKHGARIELVPKGMAKLLEDTIVRLGFDSEATMWLTNRYHLRLQDVPCGLPSLIVQWMQFAEWDGQSTQLTPQLRECVMLLKNKQQDLDAILEVAFGIAGKRNELTELLLELGASLKRVPGGVGALLEAVFWKRGHCDDLDLLLSQTDATMLDLPSGINHWLQAEILNGDRNPTTAALTNAEFLLNHGAELDKVPKGSGQVLREILDRFGKGTRSEWLERRGAKLKDE